MAEPDRDYVAEMDERIAEATKGSGWVAAVVAQKLHASLLESDPDLLDGWLNAMAVQMLRRVIGLRTHAERAAAKRGARVREFSEAADDFEAADDAEEKDAAAGRLLGMFAMPYVIDADGTQKRAADMTGPDHLFVAGDKEKTAKTARMEAAFHRAVAKKVGKKRTADVIPLDQYEAMYLSIVRDAA